MFFGKSKLKAEIKTLNDQIEVMEEQIRRLVTENDSVSITAENATAKCQFMQNKLDEMSDYAIRLEQATASALLKLEQVDTLVGDVKATIAKKQFS